MDYVRVVIWRLEYVTVFDSKRLTRATWDDIPANWLKIPSTLCKNWGPQTRRISDPERRGDFSWKHQEDVSQTEWLWTDTPNEKSSDGDKGISIKSQRGEPVILEYSAFCKLIYEFIYFVIWQPESQYEVTQTVNEAFILADQLCSCQL